MQIDHRIVISGIFCLTVIYITLIISGNNTTYIGPTIVGAIALSIGIILPNPKIDNKRGVLKW